MPKLFMRFAAPGALALGLCLPGTAAQAATALPVAPVRAAATSFSAEIYGVSALSASSVWAAGETGPVPGKTFIAHWNGSGWVKFDSRSPGKGANILWGVSADSHTDAWAVGQTCTLECHLDSSLIEHWNGKSWSVSTAPKVGESDILRGVEALSSSDVWAVGQACMSNCSPEATQAPVYDSLILNWNGTAWSQVPSPDPDPAVNILKSVSADSATDIWAVGYDGSGTVTLHWDGTAWSLVPSPNPTGGASIDLRSVSALSPTDAWAVGRYCSSGCDEDNTVYSTLALNWNGTAWSIVPSPNGTGAHLSELNGVSGTSPTDVWAVGDYAGGTGGGGTLILSWNGTSWSPVTSPVTNASEDVLYAVAARTSTDAWAMGGTAGGTVQLHWNGTDWLPS